VPRPRRASEPERELSPLAVYRAERLVFTVTEVAAWEDRGDPVTPLELYGAVQVPDFSGWWVYAFSDKPGSRWSDGRVWYAGQVGVGLWSRWRDHYYKYRDRFTAADKWIVKVANEPEADLIELVFINFYQPECNDKGRRADLEAKVRRWARGTREFDNTVRARTADAGPSPKRTGRGIT
jgi:hypothetical protein